MSGVRLRSVQDTVAFQLQPEFVRPIAKRLFQVVGPLPSVEREKSGTE